MCRWVGWCRTVWRFANFLNVLHLCWHLAFPIRGFSTPGLARGHRGISQCWQELPPSRHSHSRLTWRHSHFPAREDDLAAFPFPGKSGAQDGRALFFEQGEKWTEAHEESLQPRSVRCVGAWVGVGRSGVLPISQCSPYGDVAALGLPSESTAR